MMDWPVDQEGQPTTDEEGEDPRWFGARQDEGCGQCLVVGMSAGLLATADGSRGLQRSDS